MPAAGDGTEENPIQPKYAAELTGWRAMDYGREPVFLVYGDALAHDQLVANPDVVSPPADLSKKIGGSLSAAQNKLEQAGIPSDWLTTNMTWRTAIKGIALIFQLAQRYSGMNGERLFSSLTLDTQLGDLSAENRKKLQDVADWFEVDTSSLTATSTVRDLLREMAAQNWRAIRLGVEL